MEKIFLSTPLYLTLVSIFDILIAMVLDYCNHFKKYYSLDEGLKNVMDLESMAVPVFNGFSVNRSSSCLYTVNKGEAVFATSWRENPDSMEATAVCKAREGQFVLYLPGEPMLVKVEEGSEVSLFVLNV